MSLSPTALPATSPGLSFLIFSARLFHQTQRACAGQLHLCNLLGSAVDSQNTTSFFTCLHTHPCLERSTTPQIPATPARSCNTAPCYHTSGDAAAAVTPSLLLMIYDFLQGVSTPHACKMQPGGRALPDHSKQAAGQEQAARAALVAHTPNCPLLSNCRCCCCTTATGSQHAACVLNAARRSNTSRP